MDRNSLDSVVELIENVIYKPIKAPLSFSAVKRIYYIY